MFYAPLRRRILQRTTHSAASLFTGDVDTKTNMLTACFWPLEPPANFVPRNSRRATTQRSGKDGLVV